jgi:dTDP-glucose pyrophosphorylase
MRASAGPRHKGLVPVLGVPMLERNLCALLAEGFRDIAVAVSAHEPDVERWVLGRGRALGKARDARVECLREISPLGTIGAVAGLTAVAGPVLVVNVDNLTALSLRALLAHHAASAAAMTIASHVEIVRVPCGELQLADGIVSAYREKPATSIAASSGTYVLGPPARALLSPGRRRDVPELVNALIARRERVCAWAHDAPWIDVNDAAALGRADRLVIDHSDAFEHWREPPADEVAALLAVSGSRVLVTQRSPFAARYPALCDLPGQALGGDDATPEQALRRMLAEHPGWSGRTPELLASFDDLDVATTRLVRHHVFVVSMADDARRPLDVTAWWAERQGLEEAGRSSAPLRRALARARAR